MKLSLSSRKGVEVLGVSGSIADHGVKVLRAGLTKILKTGKNRIVLELPGGQDLSSEAIRDVAAFDVLARELSGRIVLAGVSSELKTKIEAFAKPPVILCFETTDGAVEFLAAPPRPEIAEAAGAESPKQEEDSLKKRVAALERENKALKEQVILTTLARRAPANEADYVSRIELLESKLEKALAEAAGAEAAKK